VKRLQVLLVVIGSVEMMLLGTGCKCPHQCAPKQQPTNAIIGSADKADQCAQKLQDAERQIKDVTSELDVTYLEMEQEQTKSDVLLEENQNLNEQLQAITKRLLAAESKLNELEKAPQKP